MMTNGDSEEQIFLSHPHTNNGFYFLLTIKYCIFCFYALYFMLYKMLPEVPEYVRCDNVMVSFLLHTCSYDVTCLRMCGCSFLAHLRRRLMGELIVYQSLRCPSVVRRLSSVRQHFQTSSPLKPLCQLNSNFIWRLLRTREQKFVQMVLVT